MLSFIWLQYNTKQKLAEDVQKYIFDYTLIFDCEILLGNLEMFLVSNYEDEFIENIEIFCETNLNFLK